MAHPPIANEDRRCQLFDMLVRNICFQNEITCGRQDVLLGQGAEDERA